jgi:hypothetical protein
MQNDLARAEQHPWEVVNRLPITRALPRVIASFPDIAQVSFVSYKPAPNLDERLSKDQDATSEIREIAEGLWKTYGIPFWDAILAICMKRGNIPEHYVDLAVLHDRFPEERTIAVETDDLSDGLIDSMVQALEAGSALAFCSRVKLRDGGSGHIPLMDFRCHPSASNRRIVRRALKAMGQGAGLLAESGRSFHFYGSRLLTNDEWVGFMGMAMLFSPVVDVRYIAHRLADGACRLRISTSHSKSFSPVVCEVFS